LDGVAGETVGILLTKLPTDKNSPLRERRGNDKFYSLVEEVLDTVEWKAES